MLAHAQAFRRCLRLCQWAGGSVWGFELQNSWPVSLGAHSLRLGPVLHLNEYSLCRTYKAVITRWSPLIETMPNSLPYTLDIYMGHSQMSRHKSLARSTDVLIFCFAPLFVPHLHLLVVARWLFLSLVTSSVGSPSTGSEASFRPISCLCPLYPPSLQVITMSYCEQGKPLWLALPLCFQTRTFSLDLKSYKHLPQY